MPGNDGGPGEQGMQGNAGLPGTQGAPGPKGDTVGNGHRHEKTCLWGFRQCEFQTNLLSYRD